MSEELDSKAQENTQEDSQGAEGTTEQEQPVSQDSESFTKFDLNSVDEKIRPHVEKAYKSFQGDYTRKTQSLAEEKRKYETEIEALKKQNQETQTTALNVLKNPALYEQYRKQYGPQLGITENTADAVSKFETTEDYVRYVDQKAAYVKDQSLAQARSEMDQRFNTYESRLRWEDAIRELNTDPLFQKHSKFVASIVQDPARQYISQYKPGMEKQILRSALDELKTMIKEERELGKQVGLGQTQAKKRSVTEAPQKSLSTEPAHKRSVEEVINAVRSRVGY